VVSLPSTKARRSWLADSGRVPGCPPHTWQIVHVPGAAEIARRRDDLQFVQPDWLVGGFPSIEALVAQSLGGGYQPPAPAGGASPSSASSSSCCGSDPSSGAGKQAAGVVPISINVVRLAGTACVRRFVPYPDPPRLSQVWGCGTWGMTQVRTSYECGGR
jgi:hypothetical protein